MERFTYALRYEKKPLPDHRRTKCAFQLVCSDDFSPSAGGGGGGGVLTRSPLFFHTHTNSIGAKSTTTSPAKSVSH